MKQNKPLAMAADQPLALSRSEHPWRVVSGFVDLFALRQGGPRGEGPRTFLLRVGTGGVFFPMPTALLDDEDMGIIAVGGLGAVIEPCLQPTPQDMDRWLLPLAGALQEQAPLHCDRIAAEGSLVLPRGEILAGSSQRPLWCRCPVGRLKLLGEEAAAPSELALPQLVSPTLWYAAAEDCELFFLRSEDLAAEESAAALAAFHGIAAGLVVQLVLRRRQQQAERLQRRAARSQAALESGLAQLADAISPQQREVLPPGSSDPLLAVLRHLGARLQVEVREPTLEEQRFQRGSRLDMLLKTSCLRSRPVLLRGDWWTRENGPLLAWRKDSRQPLALLPEGSGYRCWDPLSGVLSEVDDALAQTLAADGVMLYPRLPDRRIRLADFLPLGLGASRSDFRAFILMALGAALLALLVPIGTGLLVDEIIPAAARGQLGILVGGLLAAALCTGTFELVKGMTLLRIEGRLDAGVQAALFDRLLRLPATFFKHYTAGDLSDRVLGVQAIRQLLSGTTVAALVGGLFSFVSLAMLFAYDKRLALLAVALTVFSLTVTAVLTVMQLRHERAQAQDRGKVEGLVLQLVAGVTKLKVAAAQDRAIGAWAGGYARQKRRFVAAQHLAALQAVFQSLFPPLATVAIFAGVAYLLKNHASEAALQALTGSEGEAAPLGAGSFLAFQAAFGQFLGAMTHLVQSLTASLGVFPLYERAKPILEAQPENNSELPSPGLLDGAVEFAGVSFSYQPETPPVVQDLSFSLRPGEFVALVGPSGSGKSTVLRMLLGLEQPSQGEIFFDGKPVGRLNLDALRAQVAVVMQSGRILPGSVLSNIVGQEESALADAWEAARMVGLEEDIRAMPMGMHTVLMEGGGTLSGGQRQRLMIARALVRKPRILILDEATSALDNRTQAIVTESLRTLNITRLVVAHRLTTIESVDRVLVMERGRLVQSGTIEELRQTPGLFADLAQRQIF